ncbi:hypothetical protein KFE25_012758 [Diacronema lutheri]|uniref:Uncharacterized protein n=1 Tax=Diacronema lutheri TaxID=2081491 RepID=A0A8J5X7V0_DIALT|nr:hypothetical protein KFE25_012758 [Diacronema lutheri]
MRLPVLLVFAVHRPAPRPPLARRVHASCARLAATGAGADWPDAPATAPLDADADAMVASWASDADERAPPPPRRKRDRADKSPNRLGKAGLKGFVPSARDRDKVRPTLDDVTRISFGERARQRGVGSRATPHRLNAEERAEYERAIARGYLTLQGRGYRKERKGSPLLNIWRQRSDATGTAAVWLELGAAGGPRTAADGSPIDTCAVDLAPLRDGTVAQRALAAAARAAAPYTPAGAELVDLAALVVGDAAGPDDEALRTQPIWNVPFHEARFEARSRADAKALAAELVGALTAVDFDIEPRAAGDSGSAGASDTEPTVEPGVGSQPRSDGDERAP